MERHTKLTNGFQKHALNLRKFFLIIIKDQWLLLYIVIIHKLERSGSSTKADYYKRKQIVILGKKILMDKLELIMQLYSWDMTLKVGSLKILGENV